MTSPVRKLWELQDRLTRFQAQREERERMPPDVAKLDEEFQGKVRTLDELRARVAADEAEKIVVDRELDEASASLKKYQGQLMNVRTNKEYSAALNEIDTARKNVKSLEDRSLELSERLENSQGDLATREEALPGERADFEGRVAGWRSHQAACDEAIARVSQEVDEIEKEIPKALVAQFRKVFEGRGGVAVVRITGPSCGACNVRLRPALYQSLRLRSEREIITCESCKRILFFEEE